MRIRPTNCLQIGKAINCVDGRGAVAVTAHLLRHVVACLILNNYANESSNWKSAEKSAGGTEDDVDEGSWSS